MKIRLLVAFFFQCWGLFAQESLRIDTFLSPEQLVHEVLLAGNTRLGVQDIHYTGNTLSIGRFSNALSDVFPASGVLLSTGNVFDAEGPNKKGNTSTDMRGETDFHLARMANNMSFDASSLSFSFRPNSDSIRFNFIFASEEYPEYVFRGVNDVFAFFLTDIESGKTQNLALVPNTGEVVSIDNINARRNPRYYVENPYWSSQNWQYWQAHKEQAAISYLIEFDGFTKLLEAHAAVIPGKNYRLKIAISDIGDGLYDSAVFLEAGSFTDQKRQEEDLAFTALKDVFSEYETAQRGDTAVLFLPILFSFDSYEIAAASMQDIEHLHAYLEKEQSKKIIVLGHTDDRGSASYNKLLSEQRAHSIREALIHMGVTEGRISARGEGSEKPYSTDNTDAARALNRRVEVLVY